MSLFIWLHQLFAFAGVIYPALTLLRSPGLGSTRDALGFISFRAFAQGCYIIHITFHFLSFDFIFSQSIAYKPEMTARTTSCLSVTSLTAAWCMITL